MQVAWTDQNWWQEPEHQDEILTNVMLYWLSGCIGPSIRLYYECVVIVIIVIIIIHSLR